MTLNIGCACTRTSARRCTLFERGIEQRDMGGVPCECSLRLVGKTTLAMAEVVSAYLSVSGGSRPAESFSDGFSSRERRERALFARDTRQRFRKLEIRKFETEIEMSSEFASTCDAARESADPLMLTISQILLRRPMDHPSDLSL